MSDLKNNLEKMDFTLKAEMKQVVADRTEVSALWTFFSSSNGLSMPSDRRLVLKRTEEKY